jgi:hypothetical protein
MSPCSPDSALRTCGGRILDDALAVDGEVDHAVCRAKEDLRLRSRHGLIGDQVANGSAAVGHRIVMMGLPPRLNEMSRAVPDPVADIEILHGARRHWPARGEARDGKYQYQATTPIHDQFSLGPWISPAPDKTGNVRVLDPRGRRPSALFIDRCTSPAFEIAQFPLARAASRVTFFLQAYSVPVVVGWWGITNRSRTGLRTCPRNAGA